MPTPAPTPAPATSAEKIADLLVGNHALAAQVISEMDTNPLTTFAFLLLKEEAKQADDKGKKKGLDNVTNDTQCK